MEPLLTYNKTIYSCKKRIRSMSTRLFSVTLKEDQTYKPKRISSSSDKRLTNPSSWLPRIRSRSDSSASSTFSLVFSTTQPQNIYEQKSLDYPTSTVLLDSLSSELESLYRTAEEELDFATESEGSIYYEGDIMTAQAAIETCLQNYKEAMVLFGDTTIAVKFRFRWETDLFKLQSRFDSLPLVTQSIYD